ncbi:NUDIX hydrolase N-terminal domain-containing protein [Clostridium fallax]|uniref:ADP-ribose pyrophosphatase YjhB, NUDIX family n=1 Tax=Clostridium fallax TaxID=1533 RepID=A0A1M4UGX1_9CLOT|nr:NUDIX hydrolase [Clostridium fallax]SHE56001.1 ADP-ribose pyrophosphatase YjhB, NUDIX family [Clostridium fallax]SQB07557.1 mutator MutT protein [Clostridium fallax]
MEKEPKWIFWAKKLQSIAQAGLEYSKDKYDLERFEEIRDISLDIMSFYTDISKEKIKDLFGNEKGYQTPKVDVRASIIKDDKILLVKEKIDGKWSLPGGWAEVYLSPSENAIKEAFEEAGVKARAENLIAVLDRNKRNPGECPYGIYKIFIQCKYIDGDFNNNIETSESRFYPLNELPPLSLGRNTKEQIEMCFNAKNNKNYIPIFD